MRFVLARAVLGLMIAAGSAAPVRADISFVNMFRNDAFTQTDNGNSLSVLGSFLSLGLTSTGPNNYNTVLATYPGPASPVALVPVNPTLFAYQTGFYPTQAAMDADFPTGTYTFDATNASGTDTASFVYASDAYPLTRPYLTGTNYTDLQGMNAGASFAFQFSPYTPHPSANAAFRFFTIFDFTANAFVYNAGFLPPATPGLTLPANTLLPGRQYAYELIFSDRVFLPSPGAAFDAQIGYDLRTSATFTTAVPEPSLLWMVVTAIGFTACGLLRRRQAAGGSPASDATDVHPCPNLFREALAQEPPALLRGRLRVVGMSVQFDREKPVVTNLRERFPQRLPVQRSISRDHVIVLAAGDVLDVQVPDPIAKEHHGGAD